MSSNAKFDPNPLIGKIREKGFTQQEFAQKDGRSCTAVRNILHGDAVMTWETIVKWSEILEIELGSTEFFRVFFSVKK